MLIINDIKAFQNSEKIDVLIQQDVSLYIQILQNFHILRPSCLFCKKGKNFGTQFFCFGENQEQSSKLAHYILF